jgi:hypothetical protein
LRCDEEVTAGEEFLKRLLQARVDLHAGDGQGLDALLTKLVRIKSAENA